MTNVIFTAGGVLNLNAAISRADVSAWRECACLFPLMDAIDFGLHSANDSPKAAARYESHSQMPHEGHHALTSDATAR